MIQRIQSVYLAVTIILILVLYSGVNLFEFTAYQAEYKVNIFGLKEITAQTSTQPKFTSVPFFIVFSLLVLLLTLTLISYKRLQRQFALIRLTLFYYFFVSLGLVVMYVFGDRLFPIKVEHTDFAMGAYLVAIGFPLTFLAYNAIQKDKKLIDSLNRLR